MNGYANSPCLRPLCNSQSSVFEDPVAVKLMNLVDLIIGTPKLVRTVVNGQYVYSPKPRSTNTAPCFPRPNPLCEGDAEYVGNVLSAARLSIIPWVPGAYCLNQIVRYTDGNDYIVVSGPTSAVPGTPDWALIRTNVKGTPGNDGSSPQAVGI